MRRRHSAGEAALLLLCVLTMGAIAGLSALVLYWLYWPVTPVYESIRIGEHRAQISCTAITVRRHFTVHRDVTLTIMREMIATEAGVTRHVDLSNTLIDYAPGTYEIERPVELPPGLPPGSYVLPWSIEYQHNPLRRIKVMQPILTVHYDPIELGCK